MAGSIRSTTPPKRSGANGWADRLAAQMALKPAYSLRFIGVEDGHREILRVDRSGPNGAVRIVPEAELKPVGDAPYFRDTIKLPRIKSMSRRSI